MTARLLALILLGLLASGCATRGPAAVTRIDSQQRCDTRWKLESAAALDVDARQHVSRRFDAHSPCLIERGAKEAMAYALYRLPAYREDWTLEIDSRIDGHSLFAPEVLTLDGKGRVLRRLPYARFAMRGDRLRGTLFFARQDAAERYLVLRSAPAVVGRDERRVVSGSFFIPIFTGLLPLIYMQGTESERSYTLSHSGYVDLHPRTAAGKTAPRPRTFRGDDMLRAELDPLAR